MTKATGFFGDYTDGGSGEQSSSFYGTDKEYSEAAALSAAAAAASAAEAAESEAGVEVDATAAEAAKLAAQAAQAAAETAETNAESSETSAASSATSAAGSATTATTKASEASSSATSAASSAATATTQAGNASTSASNAADSATAASTSASSAATSATSAASSASTATTQATSASGSATAAASSATAAASSATSAASSATDAETAQTAAEGAQTAAETAEAGAAADATAAALSASAASTSETNASASASAASTSETNASASETASAASASAASTSETNAAASASAASTSATQASNSATAASGSATDASASATAALNSQTAAEAAESGAAADAIAAAASASAAASSETNAAASASAASTSETNAATSESNASTSATAASGSATAAASSASAASTSESNAATSATNASASETAASASETAAASSAASASTSASNASTSESNASTSASAASTSESNAATSETNAATSATNAASSATTATAKASEAATSATAAASSATSAASSASAASTSETNAASSETAASASETAAAGSAANALTSASNAATSATNASNSASAASTSASNASTSESNAATSASNAATSESNASSSATAAAGSATAAAGSASAASASADAALAALDNFDDRYLGQKTTAPTVDNDGDALVTGALYFDTIDDAMKVWDGTQWLAAYASLSGALIAVNNLSDLSDASASRTNLGLGTAATTNSTAYATAAQGTLADSALQSGDNISLLTNNSGYITDNQTITLSGDVTGSGTTSISVTIADDSHNHIIANVDGLQAALNGKVDDSQVLTNVPSGAVFTDTTYSVGNGGLTEINFTSALNSKLAGIEANANNYVLPFTDNSTNWNTAYSWGNHASAGYAAASSLSNYLPLTGGTLTGNLELSGTYPVIQFTDTDSSPDWTIIGASGRVGFYNETNTNEVFTVNATGVITNGTVAATGGNSTNWNTAYSWGNHASAGYLLSSSYTASDVLTKIKTVDGAGSGLDADLLDGQHGSYYASASSLGNYLPLTGGTLTGALKLNGGSYTSGIDTAIASAVIDRGDYIYSDDGTYLRRVLGHLTNGNIEIGQNGTSLINAINFLPGTAGNSGVKVNGNTVWNAGNDGSGSGLDADLLDGQHGSYYAPVSTLSNYLPLTGGTLTGNITLQDDNEGIIFNGGGRFYKQAGQGLVIRKPSGGQELRFEDNAGTFIGTFWHSGNDGSGSGLDADLLDGQHASAFASASHNHSGVYQPAGTYNTVIGTDTDINTSGATIIDNIFVTDGVITSMGTRTLTAADLGIGSTGTAQTGSIGASGWWKCNDTGLIIQWGTTGSISANSNKLITLPLTMPTAVRTIYSTRNEASILQSDEGSLNCVLVSTSQFRVYNSASGTTNNGFWMVIGN